MGIATLFNTPYYSGSGTTSDVPGMFPIALNGRPYILDLKSGEFTRRSLRILRQQANVTNLPDETSLNPEDLWRRSQMTWHKGAGQEHLDRQESDPARYNYSEGVNVWERWRVTCLQDTQFNETFTGTVSTMLSTSTRLYWSVGSQVRHSSANGFAFNTLGVALPADVLSSATDGYYVYFALGASGVYLTNRTLTATPVSWVTGTVNLIRWVKGRLMAAGGASIYNITTLPTTAGPTALPAALKTMANPDWRWTDFAEGPGQIYASGYSGDKSLVYRTAIKPDGTALDEPTVAGELPDGEVVNVMQGYLGYVLLGTTHGVRFCTTDGQGNLILGPLLDTGEISVTHFEPQDRFVWFSWPYDGTFGGLGRLDLSVFTSPMVPAFATDLRGPFVAGAVCGGLVTFDGHRNFAVIHSGEVDSYYETDDLLDTGWVDSGLMTYGLFDQKVGMWVDVRSHPLPLGASIEVFIAVDQGPWESLGVIESPDSQGGTLQIGQRLGREFQVRVSLTPNGAGNQGPVVERVTLRAYAAPNRAEVWTLPILLHETVLANGGVPHPVEVLDELNRIRNMISDKQLVTYQEGSEGHAVFVEDYVWTPHHPTRDQTFWQGTCLVTIKETST